MKFDLFDAIRRMAKHFGPDGAILVRQNDTGVTVRLSTVADTRLHLFEFTVTFREMNNANVNLINANFQEGIERLKLQASNRGRAS